MTSALVLSEQVTPVYQYLEVPRFDEDNKTEKTKTAPKIKPNLKNEIKISNEDLDSNLLIKVGENPVFFATLHSPSSMTLAKI